jgi:hypothetical protein
MQILYNNYFLVIVVVMLGTMSQAVTAQWSTNPSVNNVVSAADDHQQNHTTISDGSGGTIITWQDHRSGNDDIYAQRINASGDVLWSTNGIAVCTAAGNQQYPVIVGDGSGGAIIAWHDYRTPYPQIYAQRISASGVIQWTADGVLICTASNGQEYPSIASDGNGGAIIAWHDLRGGGTFDIYAQRINSSGAIQWTAGGAAVCISNYNQNKPSIISDGSGGAIITWNDYRSASYCHVYAQKINSFGVVQWTANGVAISTVANSEFIYPAIISDGYGGAIIAWYDKRSGTSKDMYTQKINSYGVVQWTANGVAISTAVYDQFNQTIASDGSGGAIITWRDNRIGTDNDIYAQKINASGAVQWIADGVAISTAAYDQGYPTIVSNGSGGAIITWIDYRNGSYADIYAQLINAFGVVQWTADGVAVSAASYSQGDPKIIGDGSGGAIITWQDYRNGTKYDIYAQRMDRLGNLYPAPWIDKVGDIANDQGGKLRLLWSPSPIDVWGNTTVKTYTIKVGARSTGILGKTENAAGSGIYWQTVGSIPADWSEGYTTVVSTYADSGLQGRPYYYFQVLAKNADSTVLWSSNIDSGYSVDNLPPVGTGGIIAAMSDGSISLQWSPNKTDKDLAGYRVFRSTTAGFVPSQSNVIVSTTDTSYHDVGTVNGQSYFYRIKAVDVHGNESVASPELSTVALSVELVSFTALPQGNRVELRWKTATETNNHGFEVERKLVSRFKDQDAGGTTSNLKLETSNSSWTRIAFVEGSGTSNTSHEYTYTDRSLSAGKYSFRLKQIDRDGQFSYSPEVEVTAGVAPKEFILSQNYPNPFNPTTNIDFAVPVSGRAVLKIYSMLGTEVATLFADDASSGEYHHVVFDARNLSSGIYIARLTFGSQTLSKKITLLK